MKFHKDKNYQLMEFENGLTISEVKLKDIPAGANPLIVADAARMLTYLDRYFYEREHGKALREAHDLAMKTAQIGLVLPRPQ